jgi:hypothetical protein
MPIEYVLAYIVTRILTRGEERTTIPVVVNNNGTLIWYIDFCCYLISLLVKGECIAKLI